jgi:molecular chaperone GrpE
VPEKDQADSEPRIEIVTESDATENTNAAAAEGAESLRAALDEKERQLAELNNRYLRSHAEFDNYKKRIARDQMEQMRFALEPLLREVLPVLDNLERALAHAAGMPNSEKWIEGVNLTHKQFLDVLGKFGVTRIAALGKPFDPSVHQAVAQRPVADAEPDTVVEELQPGYMLHERVLRPAMVVVARRPDN